MVHAFRSYNTISDSSKPNNNNNNNNQIRRVTQMRRVTQNRMEYNTQRQDW